MSTFRGHKMYEKNGEWFYSDTDEPVATTWSERPCGYCNLANTPDGHDGCIGRLVGVMNACCGHGETGAAYTQFTFGLTLRGLVACWIAFVLGKLFRE